MHKDNLDCKIQEVDVESVDDLFNLAISVVAKVKFSRICLNESFENAVEAYKKVHVINPTKGRFKWGLEELQNHAWSQRCSPSDVYVEVK